jgi:hypothetical protein
MGPLKTKDGQFGNTLNEYKPRSSKPWPWGREVSHVFVIMIIKGCAEEGSKAARKGCSVDA